MVSRRQESVLTIFTEADFAPSVTTDQPDSLSASVLGDPADDSSTSRTVPPKDQARVLVRRETYLS